jgi:hypothetical protein
MGENVPLPDKKPGNCKGNCYFRMKIFFIATESRGHRIKRPQKKTKNLCG